VVRVTPDGTQSVIAHLSVGAGLITGIAGGPDGALYVADATFAADPAPGVFRVDPGSGAFTRVLTLPVASFPNGVAFHDGHLYVADSDGPIWRSDPLTPTTLTTPWFNDALLAPGVFGFGSNGIAFEGDVMYVAVSDFGRIVSVPLVDGSAGSPTVVAERQVLRSADGIAFDADGGLYIAVNHTNRLYRLDPAGTMPRLVNRAQGLSYPTMPAFGQTADARTTLYLTSGAFGNGIPGIHAFDVGVEGLPLA
jgi:sugar lactone lactonase YvrE